MDAPPCLFAYGTLMPGHLRWPLLAPHALRWQRTAVTGRLFDSGQGWPVARFGPGPGLVPGWAVELVPAHVTSLLLRLDEVEDVATGLFRRATVSLTSGGWAVSYEMGTEPSGLEAITTWEGRPEA